MSQTIDVTGLSSQAIQTLESLTQFLRSKETNQGFNRRDPEAWSQALRRWAASHPVREIVIDDSRESIYSGRGE